jgi:hypothetical protein
MELALLCFCHHGISRNHGHFHHMVAAEGTRDQAARRVRSLNGTVKTSGLVPTETQKRGEDPWHPRVGHQWWNS